MKSLVLLLFSINLMAQVPGRPRSVVGPIDFIPVEENLSNIPAQFHRLADSVGRLSMGCTGTHIGRGLVVTAGHCFDATPNMSQNVACEKVKIRWGYRGNTSSTLISDCRRVVVMQNRPGADYAVFEVAPPPPSYTEVDLRALDFDNERATLFSHPKGQPLQWSRYCKTKKFDPAPRDPRFLYHECDTYPGSSGAALVLESNSKIVAFHKGGLDFQNLGTWNFATRVTETPIPRIIQELQRRR
jgi:V8-like Glu-specific endopeptidase